MNKIRFITKLLLASIIGLIIGSGAIAGTGDIIVDSVSAFPSGEAKLPVYYDFPIAIDAIEVVVDYDNSYLTFDSVSLIGSFIENNSSINTYVVTNDNKISFAALYSDGAIDPTNGLLYSLFFSVAPAAAGRTIIIDSTSWVMDGGGKHRTFYSVGGYSYDIALFDKGYITVLEPPPTNDSVWVDSVGITAGSQVAVGVYGKNEEDLAKIDLTLSYSSSNLIFKDVIFDLSRSESAQKIEEANLSQRHIHVGLTFGEENPLPAGSGLLATILFDVSPSANDETVLIDSTSYLVPQGQSLEFQQTVAAGGQIFAPYFTRGYVDIKSTTDIDSDDIPVIPSAYMLAQNSPNPFNPSTVIKFDLPRAGFVTLKIYNVLGQIVRNLIDEELTAGTYTTFFDGKDNNKNDIASGVYFYRLDTEGFSQSKKMMLLK
jgi:hypothetical protein